MDLLLDVCQVLLCDVPFQVLTQGLCGTLNILLVVLKYYRLVVLPQVVGKDIGEHEGLSALTQDVHGLLEKLNLRVKVILVSGLEAAQQPGCVIEQCAEGVSESLGKGVAAMHSLPLSRTCCVAASPPSSP